jgi:hypothetical protein
MHQLQCSSWRPSALLCFQVLYHIWNTLSTAKLQSNCQYSKPPSELQTRHPWRQLETTDDPRRHLMQPGAWLGYTKQGQQALALLVAQGSLL